MTNQDNKKHPNLISDNLPEVINLKKGCTTINILINQNNIVEVIKNPIGEYWEYVVTVAATITMTSDGTLKAGSNAGLTMWNHPHFVNNIQGVTYG